jgi:hypothetical protein
MPNDFDLASAGPMGSLTSQEVPESKEHGHTTEVWAAVAREPVCRYEDSLGPSGTRGRDVSVSRMGGVARGQACIGERQGDVGGAPASAPSHPVSHSLLECRIRDPLKLVEISVGAVHVGPVKVHCDLESARRVDRTHLRRLYRVLIHICLLP